jgi:hypothetical protein
MIHKYLNGENELHNKTNVKETVHISRKIYLDHKYVNTGRKFLNTKLNSASVKIRATEGLFKTLYSYYK